MSTEAFDQEVGHVISALRAYPHREITGALLGELIRRNARNLNIREIVGIPFGAGANSAFVRTYLSGHLVQSGRKGSDIVYTIIQNDAELPSVSPAASSTAWKAFVSPSEQDVLFVDPVKPEILIHASGSENPTAELLKIPSISTEEYKTIQGDFTEKLAQGREEEPFIKALRESKDNNEWFNLLRTTSNTDYRNWLLIRREKIEELFADRLATAKLPVETIESLMRIFKSSQLRATEERRKLYEIHTIQAASQEGPVVSPILEDDRFRQGILQAVSAMSNDELRKLKLPYGVVFDALIRKP